MFTRIRTRLTYANVMASVAVFIALGGTSYAAVKISGKTIKDNTVTTKDIKNRSLLSKDFKSGQLPRGQRGLQGLQGLQGAKGDPGSSGAGNTTARSTTVALSQQCQDGGNGARSCFSADQAVTARCNPGERATGGGFQPEGVFPGTFGLGTGSEPTGRLDRPDPGSGTPTGWTVEAVGASRGSGPNDPPPPNFTVYVVCAQ